MKMHISHIKTNLTFLFELLSVYIMNKKSITEIKCQGHLEGSQRNPK